MGKKIKKLFKNKNLRIVSICAACVIMITAIGAIAFSAMAADPTTPYFGILDKATGKGEFEEEYVLGTTIYDVNNTFKVLEISPCEGYGQLGYMVDNESGGVSLSDIESLPDGPDKTRVLNLWKTKVLSFINQTGGGIENHFKTVKGELHVTDCEYTVDGVDGEFYDRNFFARGLVGNSYLSNKFEMVTKKANDVTVADVEAADLIFISKGGGRDEAVYDAMAAAAAAAGDANLMAKYPVLPVQTYNEDINISEEVAWAIIQHNVIRDKALIFDFASATSSPKDYDNISKLYITLAGIDSDALRKQFLDEPMYSNGALVGYEGDMGYFDLVDFQFHFVGPEIGLGYQIDLELTTGLEWKFKNPASLWLGAGYFDGTQTTTYLEAAAGDLLSDHHIVINKDQPLLWDAYMFSAINTGLLDKQAMAYPYYNSNAIKSGYMNGAIYVFNGDCSITQEIQSECIYTGGDFEHEDVDYDKANEIYGDDGKLTNNEIIKYILGIYPADGLKEVRILEVQPAGFFEYSVAKKYGTAGNLQIRSILDRNIKDFQTAINLVYMIGGDTSALTRKNYQDRVKIKSIPVNGFNGLNDDLKSDFDLVIIGNKIGDSAVTYTPPTDAEIVKDLKTKLATVMKNMVITGNSTEAACLDAIEKLVDGRMEVSVNKFNLKTKDEKLEFKYDLKRNEATGDTGSVKIEFFTSSSDSDRLDKGVALAEAVLAAMAGSNDTTANDIKDMVALFTDSIVTVDVTDFGMLKATATGTGMINAKVEIASNGLKMTIDASVEIAPLGGGNSNQVIDDVLASDGLTGLSINLDRRDNALDGMLYIPVGDIFALNVAGNKASAGATANYYADRDATGPGYTRMTGVDFTSKTYDKIVEYAELKNMPLILADEIYYGNTAKVGSTTYAFRLGNLADESNVTTFDDAKLSHNFGLKDAYWNVSKKRVTLSVYEPGTIGHNDDLVDVEEGATGVVIKDNFNDTSVDFKGFFMGAPSTSYNFELYIDRNGDGIYRTDRVVDDNNEIFASGSITTDENGKIATMEGGQVIENQNFQFSAILTDSMVGYFRWRLVVVEDVEGEDITATSGVQTTQDGTFIVRYPDGTEKKTVNVLQIIPDFLEKRKTPGLSGGYKTGDNSGLPLTLLISDKYARENFSDNEDLVAGAEQFMELFAATEDITGFQLEIDTLTTTGYENLFLNGDDVDSRSYRGEEDYENYERNPLLAYDMVVIGFSDKYSLDTIGNYQGAVDLIKEFAGRGNAVLFAHDSMMYSNYSDGFMTAKFSEINYGSGVNHNSMVNILRAVSGQDRYSVSTALKITDKKNELYEKDATSDYWTREQPSISIAGQTYSYRELGQLQGFATHFLGRYGGGFDYSSLYNGLKGGIKGNETKKAIKLNDGQVTQYPYSISNQLSVATTHGQWYQLDLESKEDKSQEVVVWYALSADGTTDTVDKFYMANGVDAINDFYIYSKGSITYSGAGHALMEGEAEQKLFINTIIRAITSANSVPVASFESGVVADEEKHLYTQYFREEISDTDAQSLIVSFKGVDGDLRKPISNTDTNAGQFKNAYIYWDVNDNKVYNEDVDIILENYEIKKNPLYNMIPKSIDLKDFYAEVGTYVNVNNETVTLTLKDALNSNEARLGVVVEDSNGGKGIASIKLVLRELFPLN